MRILGSCLFPFIIKKRVGVSWKKVDMAVDSLVMRSHAKTCFRWSRHLQLKSASASASASASCMCWWLWDLVFASMLAVSWGGVDCQIVEDWRFLTRSQFDAMDLTLLSVDGIWKVRVVAVEQALCSAM